MGLQLSTILTAARDRHPAFHKRMVSDAVLARFLTSYQQHLISKVANIEPSLVTQQASIVFNAVPENAIGVVGAGTSGGLPAQLDSVGAPVALTEPAGSLVELDLDNAAVLQQEAAVTAATASTLTLGSAAWTVNAFAGKVVEILTGPGAGQRRLIASNTATVLTITGTFETLPQTSSTFRVLETLVDVTGDMGGVTALLPERIRQGYLVRLNASGVPYIDYTKPLVARFADGIQLPPFETLVGGTVRHASTEAQAALTIRPYRQRFRPGGGYEGWLEGDQLYLVGSAEDWQEVDSIDLRYIPIAPPFTRLTDFFLLPDRAYSALVAQTAFFAGERVNALPDVGRVELSGFQARAEDAEATFLNGVGRVLRAYQQQTRDVWP